MEIILVLQFIAHILADFFFQPEYWCNSKQKYGICSGAIYLHVLVVFVTSFLMTPVMSFLLFSLFIAGSHFFIDAIKSSIERRCTRRKNSGKEKRDHQDDAINIRSNPYIFLSDQLIHISIIYLFVRLYTDYNTIPQYINTIHLPYLLLAGGFLLCSKPANVLIRVFLSSLNLPVEENTVLQDNEKKKILDLERAGRCIGTAERVIVYVLVLLGQFTAIGFIITAKSILRYNDRPLRKTEYVLIGTLLSFAIAILLGIGIEKNVFLYFLQWLNFH